MGSGPGPPPGGEGQEGGRAREEGGALWSPVDRLQEEKDSSSERRMCVCGKIQHSYISHNAPPSPPCVFIHWLCVCVQVFILCFLHHWQLNVF